MPWPWCSGRTAKDARIHISSRTRETAPPTTSPSTSATQQPPGSVVQRCAGARDPGAVAGGRAAYGVGPGALVGAGVDLVVAGRRDVAQRLEVVLAHRADERGGHETWAAYRARRSSQWVYFARTCSVPGIQPLCTSRTRLPATRLGEAHVEHGRLVLGVAEPELLGVAADRVPLHDPAPDVLVVAVDHRDRPVGVDRDVGEGGRVRGEHRVPPLAHLGGEPDEGLGRASPAR